jgi:hypothetical protein
MAEFDEVLNTGQQSINNYNNAKIFLWKNRSQSAVYTNGTGSAISLAAGTVMGRVNASGEVDACQAGASDGSQFPIGILMNDIVELANGESVNVAICDAGDVDEAQVDFLDTYDDLDTVVSGRTYRDLIQAQGIKLVSGEELTGYDNQD